MRALGVHAVSVAPRTTHNKLNDNSPLGKCNADHATLCTTRVVHPRYIHFLFGRIIATTGVTILFLIRIIVLT